jgi:UDP-glucose 4-epimerase
LVLSQAIRRAGRVGLPVVEQGMSALAAFVKASGVGDFNLDQLDLFVHGRVVDTTRLVEEFGFEPRSTQEAFEALIQGRGMHRPGSFAALRPDAVSAVEGAVLDGIRAVRAATTGRRRREPAHD